LAVQRFLFSDFFIPVVFHSVVIATIGRPRVLQETLACLANQDCPPDEIIVSATDGADVAGVPGCGNVKMLQGPAGLCTQRNAGIRALDPRCALVTFFDDDVELAPDYCRRSSALIRADGDKLAAMSGD
jgi:glycosyltransferase involved in cell wall biosynthesis